MGFQKAMELWIGGAIMVFIAISIFTLTTPLTQETIDNAEIDHPGAFTMLEGTKLFLGLLPFLLAIGLAYAGIKEIMTPDDRTRIGGG